MERQQTILQWQHRCSECTTPMTVDELLASEGPNCIICKAQKAAKRASGVRRGERHGS